MFSLLVIKSVLVFYSLRFTVSQFLTYFSGTTLSSGSAGSSNHVSAGAIAGEVIGGVVGLGYLVLLAFLLYRWRQRNRLGTHDKSEIDLTDKTEAAGFTPGVDLVDPQPAHPASLTYDEYAGRTRSVATDSIMPPTPITSSGVSRNFSNSSRYSQLPLGSASDPSYARLLCDIGSTVAAALMTSPGTVSDHSEDSQPILQLEDVSGSDGARATQAGAYGDLSLEMQRPSCWREIRQMQTNNAAGTSDEPPL